MMSTSTTIYAQTGNTQLFIDIRERIEHQENLNDKFYGDSPKVGSASDSYLLSRVRIGIDHQFNEQWSTRFSLQDSRVFGWGFEDSAWISAEFEHLENNPQSDPMELGETWLQYQSGLITSKIGRQSIHYGNKRVFGPGAWKNSGKWVWDAAKMRIKQNKNWLDLFYGQTVIHDPNAFSLEHRHGFTGGAVYGHFVLSPEWLIEPMLIHKLNHDSNSYQNKELFYYGARIQWQSAGWKLDSTYLQQRGEVIDDANRRVNSNAHGYHVDLSHRINPIWAFGSTLAFASGDDKSSAENERFDGVYGAADKYYGRMNLMAWSNLKDYGLFANYRPHRDWELQAEYHQFYADEIQDAWRAYKNGLNAQSHHYGNELDFTAHYQINQQLKIQAGIGLFMPGDAIQQAVDNQQSFLSDDPAYSGFLQIQYKFKQEL